MKQKWGGGRESETACGILKSGTVNGVDVNYCFRIKLINDRERARESIHAWSTV